MRLIQEVLQDKPLGFFLMDDTKPFQDYSGYDRVATSTGTPSTHLPLVSGAQASTLFTNAVTGSFAVPVFVQGTESRAFSLESWVRFAGVDSQIGEQQVLGTANNMDGLLINGTVVSFVTKYLTAPESRVSFDMQTFKKAHIVGVHTEEKNSLWVNGYLVGEVSLTDAQRLDRFVPTDGFLYSGASTITTSLLIQGVGVYGHALNEDAIIAHEGAGRNEVDASDIASAFEGVHVPFSLERATVFMRQTWSVASRWFNGELFGTVVVNDELRPQHELGVSVPSTWYTSFVLGDAANVSSIYGVVLDWDGEGMSVETSLDGVTWSPAARGIKVDTIPKYTDPTNKELQIRVRFPGGKVDDPAYLHRLTATGLTNNILTSSDARSVYLTDGTPDHDRTPLDHFEEWGVKNSSSSDTITISTVTAADARPVRSLELWVKRAAISTNPTINAAGTYYQNGVVSTATLSPGRWTLLHIVFDTDITGDIIITGPGQFGGAVLYDRVLTALDISSIYSMYRGGNIAQALDTNALGITEPAAPATIYAHDWSIRSAT